MEVDRNEQQIIFKAIEEWQQDGHLSSAQAEKLKGTINIRSERQQVAQYFFIIAISCSLLAFGTLFINDKLLEVFRSYFALSNWTIALVSALLAAGWFYFVKKRKLGQSPFGYEFYMVLGGLPALIALVYICKEIGFGPSYSGFLLSATILLGVLGAMFRSQALWVGTISAFMGWYGSFSEWQSNNGGKFLSMNYPVRFTIFGLLLLGISFLQQKLEPLRFSQRTTFVVALVIFFTGLWGVSVFGNYGILEQWYQVRQTQVLGYGVLFALAGGLSLYLGIKFEDAAARDFGLIALLLNLYTRYFEFFWDSMNKGLFFLVLAISFFFLGRWIEKEKRQQRLFSAKKPGQDAQAT